MPTDTFSLATQRKYQDSPLWKPWMSEIRLRQATSLKEVEEFLEQGENYDAFSWDVETSALHPTFELVCGHCIAWDEKEGLYIPTKHINHPEMNLDHDQVWKMILATIEKKRLVVYNYKFEGYILRSMGVIRPVTLDTLNDAMIYRWLYDSDKKQLNLKDASAEINGKEMLEIREVPGILLSKSSKEINFALSNPEDATLYAAADPVMTLGVLNHCKPIVDAEQPMIVTLEHMLYKAIFNMETNPITIDRAYLQQADKDLSHWVSLVSKQIFKRAGREFNIDSVKEVGQVLQEQKVPLRTTAKGNIETNAKALEKLAGEHPIIDDILYYRSLVKERSTYVQALLHCTSPENPGVVFKFTSVGAPTGRFSSGGVEAGDPLYAPMNVQAIPSASAYKSAFCWKINNPPQDLNLDQSLNGKDGIFHE